MNRRKPMTSGQLAREKLAFRYSSALERGDFEIISAVLREAENDPVLERMLHEINDVYRAELAPPIALPSISANHNHRNSREDATMTVTYPNIRRVTLPAASRGRWSSTATLAAAIIAIILFAAVLIARRPPSQEQQANPAISLNGETVTPVQSFEKVCRVFNPEDNVTLQSDISGGLITGTLPKGIVADVSGQLTDSQSGHVWYHISAQVSDTTVTGWVRDDQVTALNTCPSGSPTPTPLSTWTPTPVPQQAVAITATPIQDAGIIFATPPDAPVLCYGVVTSPTAVDGVNVFADSDSNSVYMGRIALGTLVEILDARDTAIGGWYYVRMDTAWGWMGAEFVQLTAPCAYPDGQPWTSYPCGTNLAYVMTPTPTFIPGQSGSTEEPVLLTATAYAATAFPATTVSPCSAGVQATAFVPYPTPTAGFDLALRSGGYDLVTTEQIGDIPANARVRINSAQFNGTQWLYDVVAKDGQTRGLAYDYQLTYVPGVTPGAATPTAIFGSAIGTGFYSAVTTQPIGDIPAGTPVHISSAWYNGAEWIYQIQDANGLFADNARESQLSIAPGYEPGMPTPTAAFFDRGNLVTLEQVGDIPAGALVQTTSGYFDGTQWVYTIATLDGVLYAEARDSQLRYALGSDYGPGPTPPPTYTPTLVQ